MIDQALFRELLSPLGQEALAAAALLAPDEDSFLHLAQDLSRRFPERLARLAVEQAILRRRAKAKFTSADRLYFTREALEQATVEPVARHRAARLAGVSAIFDLGCGIGGDSLALCEHASVFAVDHDELRLAILQANATALRLEGRIHAVLSDLRLPGWAFPARCGAFFDPARRSGGRRRRSAGAYEPPLESALEWIGRVEAMAIKVSPAIDLAETRAFEAEVEFVSVDGDLKEATLWIGGAKTAERRATVLPGEHTLTSVEGAATNVTSTRRYLLEPDPAVIRASLVGTLGAILGASQIDPTIAFLTSDTPIPTPFARIYEVLEVMPFGLRRLRDSLLSRRVGRVTLKKRGSPVDVDDFSRRLRLKGEGTATVILTRVQGRRTAMIVAPLTAAAIPGDRL